MVYNAQAMAVAELFRVFHSRHSSSEVAQEVPQRQGPDVALPGPALAASSEQRITRLEAELRALRQTAGMIATAKRLGEADAAEAAARLRVEAQEARGMADALRLSSRWMAGHAQALHEAFAGASADFQEAVALAPKPLPQCST
jgi:hypothetical protein